MPSVNYRLWIARNVRRVVVKIGTNALTDDQGHLDLAFISDMAKQVAALVQNGVGVVIVSSGAVGAGLAELGLPKRPNQLSRVQATAAIGQGQLMRHFHDAFGKFDLKVAQVLVTRSDFEDRRRYVNLQNTLSALQWYRAVPIINENDAVAVDELPGGERGKFGDNDIIAALVANMLRADLLMILSVVDGVLKAGQVMDVIEDAAAGQAVVTGSRSKLGSGGMGTKLKAVGMVAAAGEMSVVANARTPRVLVRILAGEKLGTVIVPAHAKMLGVRRWVAQASRVAGRIAVDAGAAKALRDGGKSLLPSGITAVTGRFAKGASVVIVDPAGAEIAKGLTNYSSDDIARIKGLKTAQVAKVLGQQPHEEVVHRNNMTVG